MRKLGGDAARIEVLKLHRPAAAYTSHPLWQQLSGAHCSFEEACSLLAGGLAADFLENATSRRASKQTQERPLATPAAAAAAAEEKESATATPAALAAAPAAEAGIQDPSQVKGAGDAVENRSSSAKRTGSRRRSWQGLEPQDSGTYSLRLSASLASGSANSITIPGKGGSECRRCDWVASAYIMACLCTTGWSSGMPLLPVALQTAT